MRAHGTRFGGLLWVARSLADSPVGAGALRRQIHAVIRIVVLLVHHLRQPEIGDLNFAAYVALRQQNVARLQVVVDDGRFDFVQVLESGHDLHDDGARLALRYRFVLLQVEVEVVAVAVLEHRAK